MIRVAMVVWLIAAGMTATGQSTPTGAGQDTVSVAETLLAQGNRSAALQMVDRIVARDPFNVEAHHLIQRILRRDDEAAMLARYRRLAELYPASPAAQYLYGNALLFALDNPSRDRPGTYFQRALQLDPGFGWAAAIEAIFAQIRGNSDEALRLARIGAEAIRDDLFLASGYADLLRLNGLRDEAIRYMEQAAALNPDDPRFLLALWRLRMRGVDDYEAERASFAWQVAANRGRFLASAELTAELAEFYTGSAMADTNGARDLWLALADRFPQDPEARNALVRAAGFTHDLEDRIGLYERVLGDYPDSPIRYEVYSRMLRDLMESEQYDRALLIARGLTGEPEPERVDDTEGVFERPTTWGYTLQGIGYAGWFAVAQAKAGARRRGGNIYMVGDVEQPISPDALAAARGLEASDCNDPRSLAFVAEQLLDNPLYRDLGITLMERAERAVTGADPLIEQAYGAHALDDTRRDLARGFEQMPLYYAFAGQTGRAVEMVERMLAALPRGTTGSSSSAARTHYIAGKVFELAGSYRDAAIHYMISEWYSPSSASTLPSSMLNGFIDDVTGVYNEIAAPDIERFEADTAPRIPVMSLALRPVEGAAAIAGEDLGGDLLLLVFFARWNETSVQQVQALDALSLSLGDPRFSTLAVGVERPVNYTRREGRYDQFTGFRSSNVLTIALAGADLETIERLDLIGLPTTILLDNTGRVLARQFGHGVERGDWSGEWRAIVNEELARIEEARQR